MEVGGFGVRDLKCGHLSPRDGEEVDLRSTHRYEQASTFKASSTPKRRAASPQHKHWL